MENPEVWPEADPEATEMKTYLVNDVFLTLQGEGHRAGTKAAFLRLSACNLWDGYLAHRHLGKGACAQWCDTDFARGTPMTAMAIVEKLAQLWPWPTQGRRWVVVTGGEPGLQFDEALMGLLRDGWWQVAVETNGTVNNQALLSTHWVVLSPKLGGEVKLARCDELKVVLPGHVEEAKGWSEQALLTLSERFPKAQCYVQPQDGPNLARHTKQCVDFVLSHPGWRLSLQLHKLLGLP